MASELNVGGLVTTTAVVGSNTASGQVVKINGNGDSGDGAALAFQTVGTTKTQIGRQSGIIGGVSSNNLALYAAAGLGVNVYTGGNNLRLAIDSAGLATFANGIAVNGAVGSFASGIYFSSQTGTAATGAATTTSVLNHYEEGTWTPTMVGNSATKTAAANNFGRYTRIGDLVTLMGTVHWDGTETIGDYPRIGGFPFTTNATAGYRSAGSVGGTAGITLSAGYVDFRTTCDAGRTDCYIIQANLTGYAHTSGMVGNTGAIYGFAFTYKV